MHRRCARPISFLSFLLLIWTILFSTVWAASYDVGPGQAYPDLQSLVAAGVLSSGDTVVFHSDDASASDIEFAAANMAFTIESSDGAVKNLTQAAAASHRGGFLYFTDSSFVNTIDFTLSNVAITGNTAYGTDGWTSTGQGGAVATFSSLNILGTDVVFSDNVAIAGRNSQSAGQGGAIWAYYALTFSGSENIAFTNNQAIGTDYNNGGQGGAIYASTVDLSNARDISFTGNQAIGGGNNPSVHTSGLGGAIAIALYDLDMTGARDIVFSNNAAVGGAADAGQSAFNSGLGGAIFLNYSPVGVRSITGSTFLNNTASTGSTGDMSSGRGGAIFNSGANLTLRAETGGDIYFSGNTHNPGNTGAVPNSIYFGNIYTSSDVTTEFTVDADAGAKVTMLDPMASQEDDLAGQGQIMRNVDLTVLKTGAGEWILGGYNDMRSATTWNVDQGTLRLEIVNGKTTTIDLSHDATAVFNLNAGANLLVNPTDSAHFIYANDIAITGASGIWNGGAFSYGDLPGGGQNAFLSLRADNSLTNTMDILNPDGSFVSGFFEYSYYGLEWRVNDALSHDLVAWIRTRRYVPDLGGTDSSTGPGAITAQNVLGRTLSGQFANGFDCFDECLKPRPCPDPGNKKRRIWASSLYEYTDFNGGGGYLIRSPGIAVGMDRCFDNFFLGWSVIASKPEYRAKNAKIDATAVEAAIYAGMVLPGKVELAGYASIGRSWYDQTRYVRGDAYGKNYHSNNWSVGADVGRRFHIDNEWMLRPFASYRYMQMRASGYREPSGTYALGFSSRTDGLHFLRAGLETTWRNAGKSSVTGSVYYSGFYGDTQANVRAVFVQDQNKVQYTSYGEKLDRHAIGMGLSGAYAIRENLALTASYQFEAGKNGRSHFGGVGMRIGF